MPFCIKSLIILTQEMDKLGRVGRGVNEKKGIGYI
jgi:hypothetical protein